MQTITGQCLDMKAAPESDEVNFTHYTLPKYEAIVKWKTAFYSFYLPVACAMYLVGASSCQLHYYLEEDRLCTFACHQGVPEWSNCKMTIFLLQAEISDEEAHLNAKTILLKMGEYFQIQVCICTNLFGGMGEELLSPFPTHFYPRTRTFFYNLQTPTFFSAHLGRLLGLLR